MANGQIYVDQLGRAYREYNGQLVPAVPLSDPSYGRGRGEPEGRSIFGGKVYANGIWQGPGVPSRSIYPRTVPVASPDQAPRPMRAVAGMGADQPQPIAGAFVPVTQGPGGAIPIQPSRWGRRLPVSGPMGHAVSRSIFGEPVYAEDTPGGVTLAYGGRGPTPELPAGNRGIFNDAGEELDGLGDDGLGYAYYSPSPLGSRGGGRRRRFY